MLRLLVVYVFGGATKVSRWYDNFSLLKRVGLHQSKCTSRLVVGLKHLRQFDLIRRGCEIDELHWLINLY